MVNSAITTVEEVWDAIRPYHGVPRWWAELFVNVGFTASDALAWIQTASGDMSSPLSVARERDLNVTLKGYAAARGISLMGVGGGEDVSSAKADRLIHWVSTVTTPEEQETITREVSSYAEVRFREKMNGVYTAHAVANAVRSVHQAYQRRSYSIDAIVLEAGASVKSAVLAGVDTSKYHCCCPVLDVRDSVRHSLRGWLTMVSAADSGFNERQKTAALAALDPSHSFVCRRTAQDCTRQVEVICSNESTHDVPFDDLPKIMARHGARLWVGFMTRAPGARRSGGPLSGQCSIFGTRWRLDRQADKITFSFAKDGSFTYTHKFSEWISYEERFGYRWCGKYFDYVYTRLPITTVSSLAFVVVRVPRALTLLREPVYKESDLSGQVKVTSIRAVGGCVGSLKPRFEPCEFTMESLVFDRVLETRLSQGDKGNLASTLAYMRSARVRLVVGGISLGAVATVPVEVLEPAAVAVEVLAADRRRSGERDYGAIYSASSCERSLLNVLGYYSGLSRFASAPTVKFQAVLKNALCSLLNGSEHMVVTVERCAKYVLVSEGQETGSVRDTPSLTTIGCGCNELASVNAALKVGKVLTHAERSELQTYATQLAKLASTCLEHKELVESEEVPDVFVDAEEGETKSSDSVGTESTSNGSSGFSDTGTEATSLSSGSRPSDVVHGAGKVDSTRNTDSDIDVEDFRSTAVEKGKKKIVESRVVLAMREYAEWAMLSDQCARSEARTWADVLFQLGPPTKEDIERSSTARTRHAVLAVINGRVEKQIGGLREDDDYAEIFVRSLNRTTKVHKDATGRRYMSEPVTELCYTGTDLKVMNGEELSRGVHRVMNDLPLGFSVPRYTYVKGVPGSGKTYEIIQRIVEDVGNRKSVLYLTATTASKDKVIDEVKRLVGADSTFVAKTYDSYVIHGAVPVGRGSFDCAYLDEVAMVHMGELVACMAKASALNAVLYGDPEQLPWLPFMAAFEPKYSRIETEFEVETRNMTHRFGVRICAMWLDVYGSIYPCDCHVHDEALPRVVRVTSTAGVVSLPTGKLLTFTQEEKNVVRREMGMTKAVSSLKVLDEGGLSTIGEDQGGTHRDVSIVRLINKKNPKESAHSPSIYNRQPWVLVATTRHVRNLLYYTTAEDDLVVARMELASCPVRFEAVKNKKQWKSIATKAMQVRRFGV